VDAERHIHPILDCLLDAGRAGGWTVRLHTPNGLHARLIDHPLAVKMRQAGFTTVRLGLESCDPAEQARDGSKVDDASFSRAVEALFAAGFSAREVAAYVLIGRPGQRVETVRATVDFAHRLGVQVRPAQFSPIPGTEEWQRAVEEGLVPACADPLLHNNSVYACADVESCADAQAWEAVKQWMSEGNHALTE
jgi:radical SAM superfamily enzyme YgiQ (UPF0313 family)